MLFTKTSVHIPLKVTQSAKQLNSAQVELVYVQTERLRIACVLLQPHVLFLFGTRKLTHNIGAALRATRNVDEEVVRRAYFIYCARYQAYRHIRTEGSAIIPDCIIYDTSRLRRT